VPSNSTAIAATRRRALPGSFGPPGVGILRQTRAFMEDWYGFLDARRRETDATVFRMCLGMKLVAAIDLEALDHLLEPGDFERLHGFGPRRPTPWVLGGHTPVVFRNDQSHEPLKRLHLDLYRRRAGLLAGVVDEEVDSALGRWCAMGSFEWAAQIDVLVARVLCRWLLGQVPPLELVTAVGRGVIPLRLSERRTREDARVRQAFSELAVWIESAPAMAELAELAAERGVDPREAAKDLAFVLPMNAWGAVAGTTLSAVAELDRHPGWRAAVAGDEGARRRFLAEVMRLHPAAPVTFGRARRELDLRSSTGRFALRAGDTVMGVIAMAQRDPRRFPEPSTFRPQRFEDPEALAALRWAAGPQGADVSPEGRACPGADPAVAIAAQILGRLARDASWHLAAPVEWGAALTPRNVPGEPLVVRSFARRSTTALVRREAALAARPVALSDRAKVDALTWLRRVQRRSVERWSLRTFREVRPPEDAALTIVPACEHYAAPEIPAGMRVPAALPAQGRMKTPYVVPYYIGAGVLFAFLRRFPLSGGAPWVQGHPWVARFAFDSPWGNLQEDAAFARLRLAGPNPFLLRPAGEGGWEADYGPTFEGICPPVRCRFELVDGALAPAAITVDGQQLRPGDAGWRRAKLLANALDARNTVFVQHLGVTHLIVAQALAISRFRLPQGHPLRPLLDLHSYATLQVNDFAYKLLVSPTSYFIRSGFIARAQAFRLFSNAGGAAGIDHLLPHRDLPARGLDRIPGHPYAEEAPGAFEALRRYVASLVEPAYEGDEAVQQDGALARWHAQLCELLPRVPDHLATLRTREALTELVTALIYNNVAHEVCGDFSPYFAADDEESARLVDLQGLLGEADDPPALRAVLLMKQGAWSGRFQHGGNTLLKVDPREVTHDPALIAALARLQADLRQRSAEVAARNAQRPVPIPGMDPARWKLSIGF
jgi:cytochrome P450